MTSDPFADTKPMIAPSILSADFAKLGGRDRPESIAAAPISCTWT
jgi:hypothetical protein